MKTKILVVEPSSIVVEGLKHMIGNQSRFNLLPPHHNIEGLDTALLTLKPDIVIINPAMGKHAIDKLEEAKVKIVALVYQYVEQSVLHRADLIIDIHDRAGTIVERLAALASRQSQQSSQPCMENYDLTKRETAVLIEVAKGLTNKEIADKLCVSVHTVISHRKNIIHKTGIKSVAGLTVYAMLNNLIEEQPE